MTRSDILYFILLLFSNPSPVKKASRTSEAVQKYGDSADSHMSWILFSSSNSFSSSSKVKLFIKKVLLHSIGHWKCEMNKRLRASLVQFFLNSD